MQRYLPALFDRLIEDDTSARESSRGTLEELKNSIARDLEALLNTRTALSEEMLADYPEVAASVANYGLVDFAGMCISSDTDQKRICAGVELAVARHEPRLHAVTAALRVRASGINRIDFVISAQFKSSGSEERVRFDAVLEQSSQQYSIRHSTARMPAERA
jgi:type VI secretion system protein ImpF